MRQLRTTVVLVGLLVGVLVGCADGQTPVPPGAQLVHVVATESEVRLDPATVRAGDVYLVLDEPTLSIEVFQRQRAAADTPGPMTDDDLTRLAHRDTRGTMSEGTDLVACDAAQRAADRGYLRSPGRCGNVFMMTLRAGKYAILNGRPEGGPQDLPPPMAVLEVMP